MLAENRNRVFEIVAIAVVQRDGDDRFPVMIMRQAKHRLQFVHGDKAGTLRLQRDDELLQKPRRNSQMRIGIKAGTRLANAVQHQNGATSAQPVA